MKKLYQAIGTLLGVSLFRKVYTDLDCFNPILVPKFCLSTILTVFSYDFLFNFGLLNFVFVLLFYLIPRFFTILAFGGSIYNNRDHTLILNSIKERFNYTLFEFLCGFFILRNIDPDKGPLLSKIILKYGSLFICLMLLKSFHYLLDLKVSRFETQVHNVSRNLLIKNLTGIMILIIIDLSLILKFKNDIESNTLSLIFGYEILNILPLILFTLLKLLSSLYLKVKQRQLISNRNAVILEFTFNLVRFMLFVTYTWLFNQSFIFPVHVLPSGYKCFRLLLRKTRDLLTMKRNEIAFQELDRGLIKAAKYSVCLKNTECFCLDPLTPAGQGITKNTTITNNTNTNTNNNCMEIDGDVRVLCCEHAFHYECLKWWLVKSMACPICREKVCLYE